MLASLLLFFTLSASAQTLTVRDVGVVGLMSHDLFTWDRVSETNLENGRLDLSTIFDWEDGKRIDKGGNPKNGENAPVWSITKRLVEHYRKLCPKPQVCAEARRSTVIYFHSMVKDSYSRLMGEEMPESINAPVNNVEQAVLRSLHDVLPGKIQLTRVGRQLTYVLTNPFTAKLYLNDIELAQELRPFDGDYDFEYQNIKIPFTRKVISLKKIDGEFIEKFSPYNQADMLAELAMVGREEKRFTDVSYSFHLREMLAKATCPNDGGYMPAKDCQ